MLRSLEPVRNSKAMTAARTSSQTRRLRGGPTSTIFLLNSGSSSIAAIIVPRCHKGKAAAIGLGQGMLLTLPIFCRRLAGRHDQLNSTWAVGEYLIEKRGDFINVTLRVGLISVAMNLRAGSVNDE